MTRMETPGVWGPDDQLGTLNLLADEAVQRAAAENSNIGKRVSLKFPLKPLELRLINKAPLKHAHDDELYYMGCTAEDFASSPIPNGIQRIFQKGIAGRAVLIDWYSWAQAHNIPIDATSAHEISFNELLTTLEYQGLDPTSTFRRGDILVLRLGYIAQYTEMSDSKREALDEIYQTHKPSNIGVKPSEELIRFLWDKGIAAVCGDSRSFEVWHCRPEDEEWHLHEWLLAGWGMPIGELFHLEEVARVCRELGRYTFFLASEPVNVPGAVASPPNALVLF
ncbi:hypothetical protein BJX63DRAFT_419195 [Aspergillus granulosus]|uniref:Cyclase n=1 Tax=Aspergillus granulosus TaxID=176169 RepID=A0ABR4HTD5_9EURO